MSYQSRWESGDWITICDACGKKYKASQLRQRWDGLMVCSYDFEIRQPQDFVRGAVDKISIPWARSEASDEFIPINYTTSIGELNPLAEDFSTAVSKIVPNDITISPDTATDEGLGLSFLGKYSLAGSGTASGYPHTLGLSEVFVSVLSTNITVAETLTLSEVEVRSVSKVSNETITLTEVELKAAGKDLAETSSLSEASPKTINKVASETTTLSEVVTEVESEDILETLALAEVLGKATTKTIAESVSLSEAVSKDTTETIAESMTLLELVVSDLLVNRSLGSQYLGKTTLG